jgi:hypothetical protein
MPCSLVDNTNVLGQPVEPYDLDGSFILHITSHLPKYMASHYTRLEICSLLLPGANVITYLYKITELDQLQCIKTYSTHTVYIAPNVMLMKSLWVNREFSHYMVWLFHTLPFTCISNSTKANLE